VALNTGQLTQPVPGGIGRYVERLAAHLPDAGVDVVAFGPRHRHALHYERWHRVRALVPAAVRNAHADVVHAPSLAVPPVGGRPLAVTVHDLVFERYPEALTKRGVSFHRRGLAIAEREAGAIIVPSSFVAGELVAAGVASSRIHVIPHGVDVPAERDDPTLDRVIGDAGVRAPYVLAVGTVEPRKGLDVLAAAMQSVRDTHGDVGLVVSGAHGWGDRNPFPAWVQHVERASDDTLDALYRRALLLAFPSRYEGFGFPVLEAMARGCPVVASDTASIPELAGDAAVLVPAGDAAALAAAITDLIHHDAARKDLAARGRTRAARFRWDASAVGHRQAYEGARTTRP
jgi:glycosyltransferase involved in cell wall biosynthesis